MKIVIAVLLLIAIIRTTPVDGLNHQQPLEPNGPLADNQGASLDSVNPMDDHLQSEFPPSSYLFRLPRRRRNGTDDPLTSAVERMQMIARLTNVIYLQKALINGTVPPDTLISELLHFGSVTPAQIHKIDSKQMEDALTALKNLPGKLVFDNDLKKLEDYYTEVSSLLADVEGINDMKTWPDKDSYKNDIGSLKAAGDFQFAADLREIVIDWISSLNKVSKVDTTALTSREAHQIDELGKDSSSLIEAGKNLTKELPKLFEFKSKKTAAKTVSFVDQLVKGVEKAHNQSVPFPNKGFAPLDVILKEIKSALTVAQSLKGSSGIIEKLFSSRATRKNVKLPKYAINLPNGYEDISRLSGHFNNPWFLKIVKDKRLRDSFKSLDALAPLKTIDTGLEKNGGSLQEKETMSSLVSIITKLDSTFSSYSTGNAENIKKCSATKSDYNDSKVKLLVTKANDIDNELNNLRQSLDTLKTALTNQDFVNDLEKFVNIGNHINPNDDASIKTAYADFKKIKNVDAIKTKVNDVLNTANTIKIDVLKTLASDSEPLFAAFDEFLIKAAVPIEALNCFKKEPSTAPTIQVMKDLKALRDKKSQHEAAVDKALAVVRTVVVTQADLKSLNTSITGFKNFASKESDLLNLFKNSTEVYETIGPAVRGIESMKLAIDLESKIQVIKDESATVISELTNVMSQLPQTDVTLLNKIPTLGASLDRMYPSLKVWASDVQNVSMESLSDCTEVFEKAIVVVGINEDLGAIGSSLERLIEVTGPQNKGKLKKVKEALDSLHGMGTLFSSCSKNFNDTEEALTELEMFFSSFAKTISVTLPPPIAPPSSNSRYGSGGNSSKQKEENTGMGVGTIIGICAAVIVIIAVISFGLYCGCKKEEVDPDEKETLIVEKFQKSKDPLAPFRTTMSQMKRYIGVFMEELIDHGNRHVLVDGKKWDINCDAVLDKKHKLHSKSMRNFEHVFTDYFFSWCKKIFKSVNVDSDQQHESSPFVNEHIREVRANIELAQPTRVVIPSDHPQFFALFDTDFLHANYVQEPNHFLMVLTQSPQNATDDGSKISTMEKFWFVVYENKFESIFMLCLFIEPEGKTKELQCDNYFPISKDETLVFGKFTIKCTAIIVNEFFIERTMTVIIDGDTLHTLTHFQYLVWPIGSVPGEVASLLRIWKQVRNSPHGAVVHCSDGVGQTGTVAYIEELYQAVYYSEDGKLGHKLLFGKLRSKRARCVQNVKQFAFAHYALAELLFDDLTGVARDDSRFLQWMRDAWVKIQAMPDEKKEAKDEKKKEKDEKNGGEAQDKKDAKKDQKESKTATKNDQKQTKSAAKKK